MTSSKLLLRYGRNYIHIPICFCYYEAVDVSF